MRIYDYVKSLTMAILFLYFISNANAWSTISHIAITRKATNNNELDGFTNLPDNWKSKDLWRVKYGITFDENTELNRSATHY